MPRFEKVLVANRGEIAVRVLRSCRELGLATVAVYSDADALAPHVKLADEAVRLGPPPARDSYLNVEAVLGAARRSGAQAIHPGYGFFSENADFAQAVVDAGLVFIGPRPETIRQVGSKTGGRALMAAHGVPVVPGYAGADQSDAAMENAAAEIGFPVLIKASAGGGGKGMSIVRETSGMLPALAQARRVALAAFGDATLLLERYVERPRHVEVQIFGDEHGNAVHLFERECSVQRRFQKVVEESPSPAPALTPAVREALCAAGVTAAKAMGYVGAGTVEFLLDEQGRFYFLEVNTRLQVEHPVTEMVTGLDLVRLQLLVAQGRPLSEVLPPPPSLQRRGHAIEVRLCAEDPANDFLPATGRLLAFSEPTGPGVRVDSGVQAGSTVGIDYDSLLAKVITWGPTRFEAILRLRGALRSLHVAGVKTNRAFLEAVIGHPAFAAGETHTHFIDDHFPAEARRALSRPQGVELAAIGAALADAIRRRSENPHAPAVRSGFRNSPFAPAWAVYDVEGAETEGGHRVEYEALGGGRFRARCGLGAFQEAWLAADVEAVPGRWRLTLDGHSQTLEIAADGDVRAVKGPGFAVRLTERPRFPVGAAREAVGGCVAPMPGRVVQVLVEAGTTVVAGTPLVILEAMKMEHTLTAPRGSIVERVRVAAGDRVEAGAVLIDLGPESEPERSGVE